MYLGGIEMVHPPLSALFGVSKVVFVGAYEEFSCDGIPPVFKIFLSQLIK
jgi:hypothetical protein